MVSKFLKKVVFLSVVAGAILGFFLSCENPFSNNMGEKVTRELPTIKIDEPIPGSFIEGPVVFTGKATADRALTSVDVRILKQTQTRADGTVFEFDPLPNWTKVDVFNTGVTETTWTYNLDTLTFGSRSNNTEGFPGFRDGMFKIQFRSADNANNFGVSEENLYIIKNFGPDLRLNFPNLESSPTPRLVTGAYIRGQLTDLRGIHPDYPQIKIWPVADTAGTVFPFANSEPPDNHPNYGWAKMFLTGYDDPLAKPDDNTRPDPNAEYEGYYKDRGGERVLVAQFVFKLDEFTIDPATKKVAYFSTEQDSTDIDGQPIKRYLHENLPPDTQYNFRIRTRDMFFDENVSPVLNEDGTIMEGRISHFPPKYFFDATYDSDSREADDDPISMGLLRADVPISITLNNVDIWNEETDPPGSGSAGEALLKTRPNIYITDRTSRKIARPTGQDFRLQVRIYHPRYPDQSTLTWTHVSSGRSGTLTPWNFTSSLATTRIYNYTAPAGTFTPSSSPYTLAVWAKTSEGHERTVQYDLYVDGSGPEVRIVSVAGWTVQPPSADFGSDDRPANLDPYVINGNIRVIVNRTDTSQIMGFSDADTEFNAMGIAPVHASYPLNGNGHPMVKWVVEETLPSAAGSMESQVTAYRNSPSWANLAFFRSITTSPTSGWVSPDENNYNFVFRAFRDNSSGGNLWNDGRDLWLYVIAQDAVGNIGYIRQLLRVNDAGDKPVADVPLLADTGTIANEDALRVDVTLTPDGSGGFTVGTPTGNYPTRRNILDSNETIFLNFTDDDGIVPASTVAGIAPNTTMLGVSVTLTNLSVTPNFTYTLNAADLRELFGGANVNAVNREWIGALTPANMAKMLYGAATTEETLRAGFYQLVVHVTDNEDSKVAIDGNREGPQRDSKTYYFAVYNPEADQPRIELTKVYKPTDPNQVDIDLINNTPVNMSGMVRSKLQIQTLLINFAPDVIGGTNVSRIRQLTLTPINPPAGYDGPEYAGYYFYTWGLQNVNFGSVAMGNDPLRWYTLRAFDRLGNETQLRRSIQVDTEAPQLFLTTFDNGRGISLNGRVEFKIRASDTNGLGADPAPANALRAGLKWWVLPAGVNPLSSVPGTVPANERDQWMYSNYPIPTGNPQINGYPNGLGLWALHADNESGGLYRGVFDSRVLPAGLYRLWAAAVDGAENYTFVELTNQMGLTSFRVDQSADLPSIELLNPPDGVGSESIRNDSTLIITGLARDDDRFNRDKTDRDYVTSEDVNYYVRIRFPSEWVTTGIDRGRPVNLDTSWDLWVHVPCTFDNNREMRFKLETEHIQARYRQFGRNFDYFSFDGPKYYQIRVQDEPDRPDGAANFGKNPVRVVTYDPNTGQPIINPVVGMDSRIEAVDQTYPIPALHEHGYSYYRFYLDNISPEIVFDNNESRRVFNTFDGPNGLEAALTGKVVEANLNKLVISYGNIERLLVYKNNRNLDQEGTQTWSLSDDAYVDPAEFVVDEWNYRDILDPTSNQEGVGWVWQTGGQAAYNAAVTAADAALVQAREDALAAVGTFRNDLRDAFNRAPQGAMTIAFDASDIAGNPGTAAFLFYKDTRGPDINPDFNRRAGFAVPDAADLVAVSWPGDWPTAGGTWSTSNAATWVRLRACGLANWPSEFAYFTPAQIVAALDAESQRSYTVVKGSESADSEVKGTFSDEFSNLQGSFEYRLNNGSRDSGAAWTSKPVDQLAGQTAGWTVPLTGISEGEVRVDIKIQDTRGNESVVYGMVFLLDKARPHFGLPASQNSAGDIYVKWENLGTGGNAPGANWIQYPEEINRVFAKAGTGTPADAAIRLQGTVYDATFKDLSAVISRDGSGVPPVITAKYDMDKFADGKPQEDDDFDGAKESPVRLTVEKVQPANAANFEYRWTLTILEKDLDLLKAGAGDGERRYVRLYATDKALLNTGPLYWNFYLDTMRPAISPTNFEPSGSTIFENITGGLEGTAQDDTGIQYVRYSIAKWDYAANAGAGEWRGYAGGNWNTAYDIGSPPVDNIASVPTTVAASKVWTIDRDALKARGLTETVGGVVTDTPREGKYRIDLRAADYALGGGNAGNEFYEFFIDRADPDITWVGAAASSSMYFRSDPVTHQMELTFTVSDPNTIDVDKITVAILQGGVYVVPPETSVQTGVISYTGNPWGTLTVTVRPYATRNGLPETPTNPPLAGPLDTSLGTYVLELSIPDGAGRIGTPSKQFILDNASPNFGNIQPLRGERNSIVGNVSIRGNASDNSGTIKRIAYYVRNDGTTYGFTNPLPADDSRWLFYDITAPNTNPGGNTRWLRTAVTPEYPTSYTVIEILPDVFSWQIQISNTRYFDYPIGTDGSKYVNWTTTTSGTYSYDGKVIDEAGLKIGSLHLDVLLEDDAGNVSIEPLTYWVYPEGDRPEIISIGNPNNWAEVPNSSPTQYVEVTPMLNGTIRISGQAKDNERVKYVWFRVLNRSGVEVNGISPDQPYTNIVIPEWEEKAGLDGSYAAIAGSRQRPKSGRDIAGDNGESLVLDPEFLNSLGWYMANRGGDGDKTVSWFAQINSAGELQVEEMLNEIEIQVRVEDATRSSTDPDDWEDTKGYISKQEKASALVVSGAPTFNDPEVSLGPRGGGSVWLPTSGGNSVKGTASYRILVKTHTEIASIRWTAARWGRRTPTSNFEFLQDTNLSVDLLALPSDYNSAFNLAQYGMTASHEPIGTDKKQYWVYVDVNTARLEQLIYDADTNYGRDGRTELVRGSVYYPIYLTAIDASGVSPLMASIIGNLPIDSNPPKGEFTLNRRPAGLAQAVGGEAADYGPVNGISKVILWFSRPAGPVSWRDKGNAEQNISAETFRNYTTAGGWRWADDLITNGVFNNLIFAPGTTTVQQNLPYIPTNDLPGQPGTGTGGYSAVVIDRNNTLNSSGHHGHDLTMGWSAGGIGRLWYFDFNSTLMHNGPVKLRYVVIDTANNAAYYEEDIVIMNDAPMIGQIKLGTNIRNNTNIRNAFASNAYLANATNNGGFGISGSTLLNRIRSQMLRPGSTTQLPDVENGITDYIPSFSLTVDRPLDFTARNNLLAMRVETTARPDSQKNRQYHLEYVHSAQVITNVRQVKKGKVYIVDNPDNQANPAKLGALGAEGSGPWPRGYAFLAAVDGERTVGGQTEPVVSGDVRLWELNPNNTPGLVALTDASYSAYGTSYPPNDPTSTTALDNYARSAEFAYGNSAFNSTDWGNRITDFDPNALYPPAGIWDTGANTPQRQHSMFILIVYDGPQTDLFCDFALLRIPVNNNDRTKPFAQLYDMNPLTEGERVLQTELRSVTPLAIGQNRTRGGLWNTNTLANNWRVTARSGHIEPRRIRYAAGTYRDYQHSLSPQQMGGTPYSDEWDDSAEVVNPNAFFATDTVSGRVILRGYVEDDQRIQRVDLVFSPQGAGNEERVTILSETNNDARADDLNTSEPASTGLLGVPTGAALIPGGTAYPDQRGRVYFADTIDVHRHRVEWAYIWDTQNVPANFVVGTAQVRAESYNMNSTATSTDKVSAEIVAGITPDNVDMALNPGFPEGLNRYNTINFNLRPYITGIRRNQAESYHNYRSLQGRVALSRGEIPVITGFNLGGSSLTTTVSLPNAASLATSAVSPSQQTSYRLPTGAQNEPYRYRIFSAGIPSGATTTATVNPYGAVTLNVQRSTTNHYAVNTRIAGAAGYERPLMNSAGSEPANDTATSRPWIQPWNDENFLGMEGSDLWDDFTTVHIWQSDASTTGTGNQANRGHFPFGGTSADIADHWILMNPAMSVDPATGVLYASQNTGGAGGAGYNSNDTWYSTNNSATATSTMNWVDPILFSDVYRSPTGRTYTTASMFGRYTATGSAWTAVGGVYIGAPGGQSFGFSGSSTRNYYYGESTWYNASTANGVNINDATTDQFANPHIVTYSDGSDEHIHLAYYDTKDGSLKYKYNRYNSPGTVNTTAAPRSWINLDGGFDGDDVSATSTATPYTLQQANNNVAIPTSVAAASQYLSGDISANGWEFPSTTGWTYHLRSQAAAQGHGTIPTATTPATDRYLSQEIAANNWSISTASTATGYFLYVEVGNFAVNTATTATAYSLNTATGGSLPPSNTVTLIHNNPDTNPARPWAVGDYVVEGDPVYDFGSQTVRAAQAGRITVMRAVGNTITNPGANTGANIVYTIALVPLNYVRRVHDNPATTAPYVNGDYVVQDATIYTIGSQYVNHGRAPTYTITAKRTGELSNMRAATRNAAGTEYSTTVTATSGTAAGNLLHTISDPAYNHIRTLHNNPDTGLPWVNGDYIMAGDLLYTIGPRSQVPFPQAAQFEVRSTMEGNLTNRLAASTPATAVTVLTTGTAATGRLYTVTPVAFNYVRAVTTNAFTTLPYADGNYVAPNQSIYTIGVNNPNAKRARTFDFKAPVEGTLSNMRTNGTAAATGLYNVQITDGTAADVNNNTGTAAQRLFTIIPVQLNYVRAISNNPATSAAWVNGGYVVLGDDMYVLGENPNGPVTVPTKPTFLVKARIEGTLSNRLNVGDQVTTTGTAVAGRLFTATPVGAFNYLRSMKAGLANSQTINSGEVVYTFGLADANNTRATTYPIRAPMTGVLTNLFATSVGQLGSNYTTTLANGTRIFSITAGSGNARVVRYEYRNSLNVNDRDNVGFHNAIATTAEGFPVIAYYDTTNSRLKLAVSKSTAPEISSSWVIRDYVIPNEGQYASLSYGTGQYVSLRIDNGGTGNNYDADAVNTVHIVGFNPQRGQLVYVKGKLNPGAGTGDSQQSHDTANNVLTDISVRVIDDTGIVGRWSTISLDEKGNPWIAYMDDANRASMDGVKLAYYDPDLYVKGVNDVYGRPLDGWETMHVPARYRVENNFYDGNEHGRLGMENFPTRNYGPTGTQMWSGAIGYIGTGESPSRTRFRIAYYVK